MACPSQETCPLFALFTMKATAMLWRVNYCEGTHLTCARQRLAAQGEDVPQNLLPNGRFLETPRLTPTPVPYGVRAAR